eukprot:3748811-Rhodomonas_salina.2
MTPCNAGCHRHIALRGRIPHARQRASEPQEEIFDDDKDKSVRVCPALVSKHLYANSQGSPYGVHAL